MDFRKIVKSAGKTHAEASKKMFPNSTYAYQAYTRMACEDLPLNEDQLRALSDVTGYPVCQIIEMRQRRSHVAKQVVGHTDKKEFV
jgi:hypothetical protein